MLVLVVFEEARKVIEGSGQAFFGLFFVSLCKHIPRCGMDWERTFVWASFFSSIFLLFQVIKKMVLGNYVSLYQSFSA
jgi:hypothetical protein